MAISLAMLTLIAGLREIGFAAHLPALLRMIVLALLGASFYGAAAWLVAKPAVKGLINAAQVIVPDRWRETQVLGAALSVLTRFKSLFGWRAG
jgi:hypothetical protein